MYTANVSCECRQVLVNCDDMGYHPAINAAIIDVMKGGVVRSLSLMATGPYFDDAVARLHKSGISEVGVHLVLAAEYPALPMQPVSDAQIVPSLVDDTGHFFPDISHLRGRASPLEILHEVERQLEKVAAAGFVITHVDGHMFWYEGNEGGRDMHDLVADVCRDRGLPLRSATDHHSRKVRRVEMFWDGFDTVASREREYENFFRTLSGSACELIIHPGKNPDALARFTRTGERRIADHSFFTQPGLGDWLTSQNLRLVTWADLADPAGR